MQEAVDQVSKEEEARRSDKCRADVVGGLLVAWVVVLVSWVLYFHFTAVLPYTAPARAPASRWWWGQAWWCFHLASCLWLFQGGTASYFSALLTRPGYPRRIGEQEVRQHYAHLRDMPVPARGEGFSRWCTHCQQPKFGRTHHCKYCNTCVLKMDHHCPWIWNCVGQNNHRHFFLFVVYVWLSSFYGALNVLPLFYEAYNSEEWTLPMPRSQVAVSTFLNVSTVLAVSILLAVQAFLISTGQTSVEWQVNRVQRKKARLEGRPFVNPHDFGFRRNWEHFLGKHSLPFVLLPSLVAPPPLDESSESHYAGV